MNICPICLFVNPDSSAACARCGKFRFGDHLPGASTMTADDRGGGGGAPPLYDPCTATPAVVASASQVTRRTEPTGPPPTVYIQVDPAQAMTNPSPAAVIEARPPSSKPVVRVGLEVVRGEKLGKYLPILQGKNVVGRAVTEPVDIDLTGQEPVERVWVSRKHAVIHMDAGGMILEDLNSLNGTYVNRVRLTAGQQRALQLGDIVQFGTVQVIVSEPRTA